MKRMKPATNPVIALPTIMTAYTISSSRVPYRRRCAGSIPGAVHGRKAVSMETTCLPTTVRGRVDEFGSTMRRLRHQAGLSLRALAGLTSYDHSYLGQVEPGSRPPTLPLVEICDRALKADGALVWAFEEQVGGAEMRRRTVLRALGAGVTGVSSMPSLEALRQGLGQALDADHDSWLEVPTTWPAT